MVGRRKTKIRAEQRIRPRKWLRNSVHTLLYLMLAAGAAWGLREGYRYINQSERLRVAAIDVSGGTERISQSVAQQLEGLMGLRMLEINPGQVRELLLEDKRIEDAEVFMQLPQTIKVRILERKPEGLARFGDSVYLLDARGVKICSYLTYGGAVDAPVILGLEKYEDPEEAARRGLDALAEIKAANAYFWENIETIDVSDSDNMVVRLRSQMAPVYLGDRVIAENVNNYLSIARHIQEKYPVLDYVELGFPNQVAIMPKNK